MLLNRVADRIHGLLGRYRALGWLAVKTRNQMDGIARRYLGESCCSERNGEYRILDLLAPHCAHFTDVGANVGEWSARFMANSGKSTGVLFEPSRTASARIAERLDMNRVVLRCCALSDYAGTCRFLSEDDCGEMSRLLDHDAPFVDGTHVEEVQVTTLDLEYSEQGPCIDFLKVDAEGSDLRVLRGGRKLLQAGRVRFIQFEYNQLWLDFGSSLKQALEYLHGLGYEVRLVRSTGLHVFDYGLWGDFFGYANLFAYRLADSELLQPLLR